MTGEADTETAATIGGETTVAKDTLGVTTTEIAGSISRTGTGIQIGGLTGIEGKIEIDEVGVSSRTGHHEMTVTRRGNRSLTNQSLRQCRLGRARR